MNLIPCTRGCRYQEEGYCTKDTVTQPTAVPQAGCSYFVSREEQQEPPLPPNDLAGLLDAPHGDEL